MDLTQPSKTQLLEGIGASPGSATGPVHVLYPPVQPAELFPDGAVLVAHTTDPSLVLHMMKASAIVTEIGGRLCHTAIVALELGIPCVVAARDACRKLEDDRIVLVDGSNGIVFSVEPAAQERKNERAG